MPFGYQPIIDLSPLSIKLLNDQLQLLWKKNMGGINTRDIATDLRKVIDAKASAQAVDDMGNAISSVETRVTQTAQEVALKAGRDDLDAVEGRMRAAEAALTVQAGQIEGRVAVDELGSLIRQNADAIRLAVGVIGGENLVRNGAAVFGLANWENAGCVGWEARLDAGANRSAFCMEAEEALGGGGMRQAGLTLRAGTRYGFSCLAEGAGLTAMVCDARGERLGGAELAGAEGTEGEGEAGLRAMAFAFETPLGLRNPCSLHFHLPRGAARVTDVQIEEGDVPTAWKPHPNELAASGVQITDERVRIDARAFELALHDESGEVHGMMTADASGFQRMYVSEDLYLRGMPLQLPAGEYHLWVHPYAPSTGGRYAGAAQPGDASWWYPSIQGAIDAVPRWCNGDVVIHVWGDAGVQYPEARIRIDSFFGGGSLTLRPWSEGQPFLVRRVEIVNNALGVTVERAFLYASGAGDIFYVANATATLIQCVVDGRLLLGYADGGYSSFYNALLMLRSCEAHNCPRAARASAGGRIFIDACSGSGNECGTHVESGGIVNQNSHTFPGTTVNFATTGGAILGSTTVVGSAQAPPSVRVQHIDRWMATATRSVAATWRADNDHLYQGMAGEGVPAVGLMWFDRAGMASRLAGREIVAAHLTIRRRSAGGTAGEAPLRLAGFPNASAAGEAPIWRDYGRIGGAVWGQTITAAVPARAIEDLRAGTVQALGVYATSTAFVEEYAIWEGKSGATPVLDVCYR